MRLFDAVLDGIITEPDDCNFNPEPLLCTVNQTTACLTEVQLEAIKISTRHSSDQMESSSTRATHLAPKPMLSQEHFWRQFVGLGVSAMFVMIVVDRGGRVGLGAIPSTDPEHDFTNFSVQDIALSDQVNFGGIATFDGDLSHSARAGKIHYLPWPARSPHIIHQL
ncbi:hypothetical protein B0H13DRAFT_2375716 [Mycena leptocephala]|nr:hypothetical protein B0H13DRAFT_2375716 [Mycena leptocephala]